MIYLIGDCYTKYIYEYNKEYIDNKDTIVFRGMPGTGISNIKRIETSLINLNYAIKNNIILNSWSEEENLNGCVLKEAILERVASVDCKKCNISCTENFRKNNSDVKLILWFGYKDINDYKKIYVSSELEIKAWAERVIEKYVNTIYDMTKEYIDNVYIVEPLPQNGYYDKSPLFENLFLKILRDKLNKKGIRILVNQKEILDAMGLEIMHHIDDFQIDKSGIGMSLREDHTRSLMNLFYEKTKNF